MVSYNLGDKDVLAAGANFMSQSTEGVSSERYLGTNTAGLVDSDYLRTGARDGRNRNYGVSARLDHKGDAPNEVMKFDLRLSGARIEGDARYATDYTVRPLRAQAPRSRLDNLSENRIADFTGDYELPGEHGTFRAGYKLARTSNVFDNAYFDIDAPGGAERSNTARTNRFELDETTAALYASYQWRIDRAWSVSGGLRTEYTDVDMFQATTNVRAGNHYLDAIPSAFVTYGWSDDTTIRLNYAKRIRRPGAGDLNPFVVYVDEFNVSSGNPSLQPSDSHSLELGLETKLGKVDTTVRLYGRRETDLISERRIFIADNVLLTTRENAGSSRSGGLEFTLGGKATEKLNISASGNVGHAEQTVLGRQGDATRSATSITGRARIAYQYNRENNFNLSLNAQGKTLFGEGYRQPSYTADIGYRRSVTPTLSLVVNVSDLFDSQKTEIITETDRLREYSIRRPDGRRVMVALSYRFGGFSAGAGRPGGPGGPGMRDPGGPDGPRSPGGMGGIGPMGGAGGPGG
nr:outer membrane beta-barrel family protein [Massilia sp. Se16.2.3]